VPCPPTRLPIADRAINEAGDGPGMDPTPGASPGERAGSGRARGCAANEVAALLTPSGTSAFHIAGRAA